jgi:DNA polymerase zeta
VFDAKGIETVRRDQCPAVAKMLEAVLRLLFTTKDLSRVGPGRRSAEPAWAQQKQ